MEGQPWIPAPAGPFCKIEVRCMSEGLRIEVERKDVRPHEERARQNIHDDEHLEPEWACMRLLRYSAYQSTT